MLLLLSHIHVTDNIVRPVILLLVGGGEGVLEKKNLFPFYFYLKLGQKQWGHIQHKE